MHRATRILIALVAFLMAGAVSAQASRTWVSGVGDDANPCSRTAPCKTFAGAISKTAPSGIINTLDPGGFGSVTITKSITIEAEGQVAGVLNAGTTGIIINAAATDRVVLRNLRIHGFETGVNGARILQAGEVVIEDTTIEGQTQNGVKADPVSSSLQLTLRNCIFRGVGIADDVANETDAAILLKPGATGKVIATIDDTQVRGIRGGLKMAGNTEAVVRDSVFAGGAEDGIVIANASGVVGDLLLDNVTVHDFNGNGLGVSGDTARMRVANSTITGNASGLLAANGGLIVSFGNNRLVSNALNNTFSSSTILQ